MNSYSIKRICAAILCMAMLLLSGCAGIESGFSLSGKITMLSNTYSSSSDLSPAQWEMLQDVNACVANARLEESTVYSGSNYTLLMENSTKYDLCGNYNFFRYNADGVMIDAVYFPVELFSGESLAFPVAFSSQSDPPYPEDDIVYCQIEFSYEEANYISDLIKLKDADGSGVVKLSLAPEQSMQLVLPDGNEYTLNSVFLKPIPYSYNSYYLMFSLTKTFGFDELIYASDGLEYVISDIFSYRVLDEDNTVLRSGILSASLVNTGETILLYDINTPAVLPVGSYTVELLPS